MDTWIKAYAAYKQYEQKEKGENSGKTLGNYGISLYLT